MSIRIIVEGFSISKKDDETYGLERKFLTNKQRFLKQPDSQRGTTSISLSIWFNKSLVTPVNITRRKWGSNNNHAAHDFKPNSSISIWQYKENLDSYQMINSNIQFPKFSKDQYIIYW